MRYHAKKSGGLLVLCACWLVISGCLAPGQPAVAPVDRPPADVAPDGADRWWQIRFVFDWPEKSEPDWHLDLLVAHAAAAPVLEKHADAIRLWRFHRRAARDAAGHQFSLIVFTDAGTSGQMFAALQADPTVAGLKSSGRLQTMALGPTGANGGRHIGDTSDPRWSAEVRNSWPWFIMGVSRMWLALADEKAAAGGGADGSAALSARIDYYDALNERVTEVWQKEGAHALLHHLNGIFGFEPLVIREERFIRF